MIFIYSIISESVFGTTKAHRSGLETARIDCSMTEKEYEQQYSDALAELRSRACKVASPYTTPDCIRRVRIDNSSCTDRVVFQKAWGQQITEKIMSEKPSPTLKHPDV